MDFIDRTFGERPRKRVAAALVAATLGLGMALAATAAPDRHRGSDGMFRNMEKLHAELKLNPAQEALWQKAEGQMKQNAEAARARHEEMRRTMQTALDQPNPDLRALSAQMDKMHDQDVAVRRQGREQWLAFYDGLDAGQKEQVRSFLRERMQRAEHFRDRTQHHHRPSDRKAQ